MQNLELKIIYEDDNLLAINKPAGIVVYSEKATPEKTLIDLLLKEYSDLKKVGKAPRHGIVHRLDKDTSGILLVAKNNKSLIFLQKQFKEGEVEKKYLALVVGNLKNNQGVIDTLIGRAPKNRIKQKVYLAAEPGSKGKRKAVTKYKVIERFSAQGGPAEGGRDYTLLEVFPKTGRRHQIRCHFSYLDHPVAGDKMYGFKNQPCPKGLNRHFLHANYIKIKLLDGKIKEFRSPLPKDLKLCLQKLKH